MYAFEYVKASSVAHAAQLLAANPEAKPLAGGMTLLPTLKQRLAQPSHLVDIGGLAELQGIAREGETLVLGAGVCHVAVAQSATVRESIGALAALANQIGDPAVRNRGTVGGSLANNDPAADYPAAALALQATVYTNKRAIAADDFFQGMFTTALEEGELVTRVVFPLPKRAAYAKFPHPASGYAMTGVFVADTAHGVRVAVTGAGPGVFRWVEAENALSMGFSVASVAKLKHPADGLNEDIHAPAAYRANLIDVMTRRAVAQITGEKA
jgi:aerobic carbon-monoxide dehydrogenase medium subunit